VDVLSADQQELSAEEFGTVFNYMHEMKYLSILHASFQAAFFFPFYQEGAFIFLPFSEMLIESKLAK
jgi:hypothetical protein